MTKMKCDRRYIGRYAEHLDVAMPSEAIAVGGLFHLGGMHYYLAQRVGGPPEHFQVLPPIEAMRQAPARIAWVFERTRRIWEGYEPWAKRNDRWKVLDVEREYKVRLGGHLFTTRIDLTVLEEGTVRFYDHKSSGGALKKLYLDYEMSPQLVMHQIIGEAVVPAMYGAPFGGVWINAVSTRSGGGPIAWREPLRIEPVWRAGVIRSMTRASIEAAELEERYKREKLSFWDLDPNPTACRGRYDWCPFRSLCLHGESALREYVRGGDIVTALGEGAQE